MRRFVLPAVALALVAGCFEPSRPERIGAIVFAPEALLMASGAETTLVVRVESTEGRQLTRAVSLTSANPSMVTVSPDGRVVAGYNTTGSPVFVTITATTVGFSAEFPVGVLPSPIAAFSLPDGPVDLAHGDTLTLAPTITDAGGRPLTGRGVTFVSRHPSAATITSAGAVTTGGFLKDSRSTYLVASSGIFRDSVFVTVAPTTVASLVVTPAELFVAPGKSKRLEARALSPFGLPVEGSPVIWRSLDPGIATIDAAGLVTGQTLGAVAVQADFGDNIREAQVTVNTCGASPPGAYPIEVRFTAGPPGGTIGPSFACAVERLMSAVVGPPVVTTVLSNFNANGCVPGLTLSEEVRGLVIHATIESIDGPGGVLGSAGPCYIRAEDGLPFMGRMRFDTADLIALAGSGRLDDVIIHEMLHVLGVGVVWNTKGVFGIFGSGPQFLGPLARAACVDDHNGASVCANGVPIEDCVGIAGCGPGTINSHWKEPTFRNELMTGYLNSGINPFSRMTIQSLADIGYNVDATQGEDYFVTGSLLLDGATPAGIRLPAPQRPTHVVDRFGNPTRIQD